MNVEALVTDEVEGFLDKLGEEVARYNPDSQFQKNSYTIDPVSFTVGDITVIFTSTDVGEYLDSEGEKFTVTLSVPQTKVSNPDPDNVHPYIHELDVESDYLSSIIEVFDSRFSEEPNFMIKSQTPSNYTFTERFTVTVDDLNLEEEHTIEEVVTVEVNREVVVVDKDLNPLDEVSGDMAFVVDDEASEDIDELRKQDTFQFDGREVSLEQRVAGLALVDVETDEVVWYITGKWDDWGELLNERKEVMHDDEWSSGLSTL